MLNGAYSGVVIVLCTPFYVTYLGIDGYAVISFWLMMQLFLLVFDMGFGATLIKEFAASPLDCEGSKLKLEFLRTFELITFLVAAGLAVLLIFLANFGGEYWFRSSVISTDNMSAILMVMAIALAVQFPSSLYVSGLVGLHRHREVSLLQIGWNTARYGLGLAVIICTRNLVIFFFLQSAIALLQSMRIRRVLLSSIPISVTYKARFNLNLIRGAWVFSLGIAATSFIAVALASIDRVMLTVMLSAEDLGKYALAFSAAGLVQMGIQPFYRVFYPKFSELISADDSDILRDVYFDSCSFMAALIIPIAVVGAVFSSYLFYAWMGVVYPETILAFRILLISIALSGLMWLPAAFQHAHNWTQLHMMMMVGAIVVGIPATFLAIEKYGLVGGAAIWVVHGSLQVTVELYLMHRRLLVGQMANWCRIVVLPPLFVSIPLSLVSLHFVPSDLGRWASFAWPAATGFVILVILYLSTLKSNKRVFMGH